MSFMRIRMLPLTILVCGLCATGCGTKDAAKSKAKSAAKPDSARETDAPPEQMPTEPPVEKAKAADEAESLKSLKATGAKMQIDDDGFVVEVDFRGTQIDDAGLGSLAGLRQLTSVTLAETGITDEGLKILGRIATLKQLDLRHCAISNAGIAELSGLHDLEDLRLLGTNGATTVDDQGMASVAKLTALKTLALDFLWVSEAGLEQLASVGPAGTTLPETHADRRRSSGGTASISTAEGIADFPNTDFEAGLEHVAKLNDLVDLDLSENAEVYDDGLSHLSAMKQLKRLNLWRVIITNDGVAHLAGLTNLEWLNLDNTHLTDDGLPHLVDMKKLKFLHLGSTSVSNAGLKYLEGLTALEDLKVTRTAVTEEGVEQLQEKLPDTEIQLIYIEGQ